MDIIKIGFNEWKEITISFNWIALLICVIATIFIIFSFKYIKKNRDTTMKLETINCTIGNMSYTFKCDYSDREIAYKIWVEMESRKVGLPIDKENDVIYEVYKSWYDFFKIVREIVKQLPGYKIESSSNLIVITLEILNKGMRPHLTQWQAKFNKWYEFECKSLEKYEAPQNIQKKFENYNELINSMLEANKLMIDYKMALNKIVFKDKE